MTIAKIIGGRDASDVVSCDVTTPVADAIKVLAAKRIGALPVMSGGKVIGIVSERDIIYCLAEKGSSCLDKPVETIMTSPVITIEPNMLIDDALALMTRRRFRHFPVVKGDKLIAFISIGDLVKSKIDVAEHEAAAMRDYIQTV